MDPPLPFAILTLSVGCTVLLSTQFFVHTSPTGVLKMSTGDRALPGSKISLMMGPPLTCGCRRQDMQLKVNVSRGCWLCIVLNTVTHNNGTHWYFPSSMWCFWSYFFKNIYKRESHIHLRQNMTETGNIIQCRRCCSHLLDWNILPDLHAAHVKNVLARSKWLKSQIQPHNCKMYVKRILQCRVPLFSDLKTLISRQHLFFTLILHSTEKKTLAMLCCTQWNEMNKPNKTKTY